MKRHRCSVLAKKQVDISANKRQLLSNILGYFRMDIAERIASGLKENKSLTKLSITDNDIGDKGDLFKQSER